MEGLRLNLLILVLQNLDEPNMPILVTKHVPLVVVYIEAISEETHFFNGVIMMCHKNLLLMGKYGLKIL